jgi:SanA protein
MAPIHENTPENGRIQPTETPPDPTRQHAPEPGRGPRQRNFARSAGLLLALGLAAGLLMIGAADLLVSASAGRDVVDRMDALEPMPVALILGTASTHRGRPNQFYRARIEAAAALFHSGKVRGILVSGDNATRYYNEPIVMQKDLIALGVPPEFITLDYAGFRTLDSVIRAKKVFGQQRLLIVSQRFHVERAIFLARHFGIAALGFAAADPVDQGLMKVRAREVLARVVAVFDLATGRGPKYLGNPETVRLRDPEPPGNSA